MCIIERKFWLFGINYFWKHIEIKIFKRVALSLPKSFVKCLLYYYKIFGCPHHKIRRGHLYLPFVLVPGSNSRNFA